ncbi:hypothetical protein OS190_08135 [Sulfitobacter sp. F26204]|uniref:hypothetical protein n=1 Tax=Sulfitobacter sp. F26204 TaxID=2996014 RepID=UPI00225E3AA2|nr:hypothetical protein [Sulfitobacter sp. F26204]MCX7559538.1 hypothetical protein [Sulfitobacter sp. F26204]
MGKNIVFAAALSLGAAAALAQDVDQQLTVELNSVASAESGCLLTFMVTNSFTDAIDSAIFETVLFTTSGQVDRLTLFDFGNLPSGRPRVRQFQVDGLRCDDLGQVLINGASTCQVDGAESSHCAAPTLKTRTETEFLG